MNPHHHYLLIVDDGEKLHLATHCDTDALAKGLKADDLLRDLSPIASGLRVPNPERNANIRP